MAHIVAGDNSCRNSQHILSSKKQFQLDDDDNNNVEDDYDHVSDVTNILILPVSNIMLHFLNIYLKKSLGYKCDI